MLFVHDSFVQEAVFVDRIDVQHNNTFAVKLAEQTKLVNRPTAPKDDAVLVVLNTVLVYDLHQLVPFFLVTIRRQTLSGHASQA